MLAISERRFGVRDFARAFPTFDAAFAGELCRIGVLAFRCLLAIFDLSGENVADELAQLDGVAWAFSGASLSW